MPRQTACHLDSLQTKCKGNFMPQLFEISNQDFSGSLKQTVNARELHAFLESKQDFSTWIKKRIAEYRFVENQDFTLVPQKNGTRKSRGYDNWRTRIDYFLSLDMAKELSMVERNDKGKQARQYFIECERRVNTAPAIPQTLPEALRLAANLAEQNQNLRNQAQLDAPKVHFANAVSGSGSLILIRDLAKLIKQNGIDIGEKRLFAWLRENGYLTQQNKPTQRAMGLNVFEMAEAVIVTTRGDKTLLTTKVTGKGQVYFINKFLEAAKYAA